ncbi:hypothetical protein H072_11216 [Dactylellina haptotyla CBS 200.50]|uniref:F-box domain-containing protein n=1 Tax=Dactylellina haptotyla (strain CBS 200.50) TaxID=1284197 RepID=S8BJL3_DACHA|nr:hypothetical protein H072_11216 [Dactylellina haptotyla CBS 200.50]
MRSAGPSLLTIPREVLESIFKYVPKTDLKNVALTSSKALDALSPILFRRLTLSLERRRAAAIDPFRGDLIEEICFDSEDIEAVLNAGPRGLAYLKEFRVVVAENERTDCLSKRDDFMLRLVLQKLADAAPQLETINIVKDISLKTVALILNSLPCLRVLRIGNFGLMNKTEFDAILALQSTTTPIGLEVLEFGIFGEDLVPAVLQILRRCSQSLQELRIQTNGHFGSYRFGEWGVRFSPGSREIEKRKQRDQKFSLPRLERIHFAGDERYAGFLDLFGHLVEDCNRLSIVRLDRSLYGHNFLLELLDKGAAIKSLQLIIPYWEAGGLRRLHTKLSSLETLKISPHGAVFISDIEPIFEHRFSLKRLWIECGYACFPGGRLTGRSVKQGEYGCIFAPTFLDVGSSLYPFTSEDWPALVELAIPYFEAETIPFVHNLRVLRLVPKPLAERGYGENFNFKEELTQYIKKLWANSWSRYYQSPKLEVIVIGPGQNSRDRGASDLKYFVINRDTLDSYQPPKLEQYKKLANVLAKCAWSLLLEKDTSKRLWEEKRRPGEPFDDRNEERNMVNLRRPRVTNIGPSHWQGGRPPPPSVPLSEIEQWKLARTCTALWNVLSPLLYRAWYTLLVVNNGIDCGLTPLGAPRQCGLEMLQARHVERLLNAPPRFLSNLEHFMVINLNRVFIIPHKDEENRSLIGADQLLLRFVLQKLSAEASKLNSIRFSNDISAELFDLIISSMPNLGSLRLAGVRFEQREEEDVLKSFEKAASLPLLETLEIIAITDLDIIKKATDIMDQKAVSITCLEIQKSDMGFEEYIGRGYETNSPRRVTVWEELTSRFHRNPYDRFLPVPGRIQRKELILPTKVEIKSRVLQTLHLNSIDDGGRMVLEEIEKGAKITNLQLITRLSELKPRGYLIDQILDRIGILETLHISTRSDWDISKVLRHRKTLKRLWLECHTFHQFSTVKSSLCPGGATFFDPQQNTHPFTSEHWPLLEELAIPLVDWEKLPLIHYLRVLRLLSNYKHATSAEYRSQIETYVERLRMSSLSQYNQLPHLKVIVFDRDEASYINKKMTFYVVKFEKDQTKIRRTRNVGSVLGVYTARPRLLMERALANESPWRISDFSADPDRFRKETIKYLFDFDSDSDSEAGFDDLDSFIEDDQDDEEATALEIVVQYPGGVRRFRASGKLGVRRLR